MRCMIGQSAQASPDLEGNWASCKLDTEGHRDISLNLIEREKQRRLCH